MKTIERVRRWLFQTSWWLLVAILGGVMVVRTGLWGMPGIFAQQKLALDPFSNPFFHDKNSYYLVWNWLGPFIAWALRLNGRFGFIAMYGACSIGFVLLFAATVRKRLSDENARKALVLFFVLPVSATSFYNIGYDSLTLLLMMAAMAWPRRLIVTLVLGILLGMQHFEISFFAFGGLLAALVLGARNGGTSPYTIRFACVAVVGTIIGRESLVYIFATNHMPIDGGRLQYLTSDYQRILLNFFYRAHVILWSLLSVGWLVALRYADRGRSTIPFFLALFAMMLVLVPIVDDQTRVGCMVTFPLIATFWLLRNDWLSDVGQGETALLFVLWMLSAWSWVLVGSGQSSAFPFDIAAMSYYLFGWPDVPGVAFMQWPFVH